MTHTKAEIESLLAYNPNTGVFLWKVDRPLGGNKSGNRGIKAGSVAGWPMAHGYWSVGIDRRAYLGHRLAWLLMTGEWPTKQIDHINMDRSDNRFANLREATKAQNMRNRYEQKNNTSGMRGVYRNKAGKFDVYIKVDRKRYSLGRYPTLERAIAVRLAAEQKHYGEYRPASELERV